MRKLPELGNGFGESLPAFGLSSRPQPHPSTPALRVSSPHSVGPRVPGPAPRRPQPIGEPQSRRACLTPAGSDVPHPTAAGFKLPEAAPAPEGETGQTAECGGGGQGPQPRGRARPRGRRGQWEIALAGAQSLPSRVPVAFPWLSLGSWPWLGASRLSPIRSLLSALRRILSSSFRRALGVRVTWPRSFVSTAFCGLAGTSMSVLQTS